MAVQAQSNAVEMKTDAGMATLTSKETFPEIDGTLDLAEDIGLHRVVFFNFIHVGRARGIREDGLTLEER
jgi:MoaA/NifB/PqqE/SkfB family radical SAM enzyme